MTRGVNPDHVFTRAAALAAAAELIPNLADDGQAGYDIRTRRHAGFKVHNPSGQVLSVRIVGYTAEDEALAEPFELAAAQNVPAGETKWFSVKDEPVAWIQAELTPAAQTDAEVKVVFGTKTEG